MVNLSSLRHEAGTSLLHRVDARIKVVVALSLIVGIVVTPDYAWLAYPLLWTLVGILAAFAQLNIWHLGRQAGLTLPFALAAVTLLVTTPGQPVLRALGLVVTDTGLARFVGIVLKSWLSMHVALLLSWTTPFPEILSALKGLRVSDTLTAIISFMYRYLFTLKDEAERLLRARAARSGTHAGIKSGGNVLWRAQVVGGMVGSLFLRSYERSERVYAAMLARGYNGHIRYPPTPPLTRQAVALGVIPIIAVIIIQIVVRL